MDISFDSDDLDRLETETEYTAGFSREIVIAYRKRIQVIRAAADERDLYAMKSYHFEKLKGSRSHQHSIRLNDKMRLILQIQSGNPKNKILVIGIEDYH